MNTVLTTPSSLAFPAILFEPDGYVLDGPKLMGRQAAGHGFLRALIGAAETLDAESLVAWTLSRDSARVFAQVVAQQAPKLKTAWVRPGQSDMLARLGGLYLPGPGLAEHARHRLRAGPAAYSLTGVTHTLASEHAMGAITSLLEAPVMPWDALICTSSAARNVVQMLFQLQAEYLQWRFGCQKFVVPQLPVIPLGVHQNDFVFDRATREAARQKLGLAANEVAVLFAGRLSFHAKAHPYPMFVSLQSAAKRSGQAVTLLLCGQFPNDAVKTAFLDGAKAYAPLVTVSVVNGKDFDDYRSAWAASDIFVSLSDNLQETFGITPLEAMASGLPVVVSDWNGYKDTVVDGETGYRIASWMPPPDLGAALASAFEAGTINYDRYIGLASLEVSLDNAQLTVRLMALIENPELRQKMGAAGKARVAQQYDWAVVIKQYLQLWSELASIRAAAKDNPSPHLAAAPRSNPASADPYRVFAGFPTRQLSAETLVRLGPTNWRTADWAALRQDALFNFAGDFLPKPEDVSCLLAVLSDTPVSVLSLSERLHKPLPLLIHELAILSKLGLVAFSALL
jgi:glycosyltransferase involved in cell wall biosynthesis